MKPVLNLEHPADPPTPGVTALLKVKDLSDAWGVSPATIYNEVKAGHLRAVHVAGKLVRFHPDDADEYVCSRRGAR